MGYMKHSGIIATTWSEKMPIVYDNVCVIIKSVDSRFMSCLTLICAGRANGFLSFAFLPDGSKEGWDVSDTGDTIRQKICDYLDSTHQPGDAWVEYIEVTFGGDDRDVTYRQPPESHD